MDLIDKLQELSLQAQKQRGRLETEEATKTALVLPLINALGYNVFDPSEVMPEFTADVGVKKGEKVDFAILMEDKPIILMECKSVDTDLKREHAAQLYRYFAVTDARFGILTNGLIYQFYSDLEKPNVMDDKPFFVFDLENVHERSVSGIKRFEKSQFDLAKILSTAADYKYRREIINLMEAQLKEPTEDFVRFVAGKVYTGSKTSTVIEDFTEITKQAMQLFVSEQIEARLKSVIASEAGATAINFEDEDDEDKITTTSVEIEGYFVVKAILHEVIDASRVIMRDTQSYCGILLDDNNRKPIARLHFNRAQKHLGLFDAEKNEERVPINNVNEIYKYADRIKETVGFYE